MPNKIEAGRADVLNVNLTRSQGYFATGPGEWRNMDFVLTLIDVALHLDRHLASFVGTYGTWVYALLFAIVFVETGLVVMPFLPGDSLLFVAGALCGAGMLELDVSIALLAVAAIAGDQLNYSVGWRIGPRVFAWNQSKLFNRSAFDRAHAFYERHGGITIVIARFLPFLRTFAPFVAGVAQMRRARFTFYNAAGGMLWIVSLTLAGYFFGNVAWVQANLNKIIWALVLVPGLIALYGTWRSKGAARAGAV